MQRRIITALYSHVFKYECVSAVGSGGAAFNRQMPVMLKRYRYINEPHAPSAAHTHKGREKRRRAL